MKRETLFFLIAVAALVVFGGGVVVVKFWQQSKNAKKYLPALRAAESKHGIPRDLLGRIAYQESRFRDDIISGAKVSPAGAQGLMQIVPKSHPLARPLDPLAAIDYAGSYLASLYKRFKSWPLAVAAYNAGPGNVSKYKGVPPFPETQNYVKEVFADLITNENKGFYA